jgi:hypothetical protein
LVTFGLMASFALIFIPSGSPSAEYGLATRPMAGDRHWRDRLRDGVLAGAGPRSALWPGSGDLARCSLCHLELLNRKAGQRFSSVRFDPVPGGTRWGDL